MEISAIKYEINGRVQYVGLVRADSLVNNYAIDRFQMGEDGSATGHQRVLSITRSKKFCNYLKGGRGTFHQTVLANVRDTKKIRFTSKSGDFGVLKITSDLFIVDGQHRVGGLKILLESESKFASMLIPINIMVGLPIKSEATEFLIVNKTQKGVRADLTDALIAKIIPTGDIELLEEAGIKAPQNLLDRLISVTQKLNSTKGNLWYKRIDIQGNPKNKTTIISQKSYTDSLRPVLKDTYISIKYGTETKLTDLLKTYWQAISELCKKATENDELRNYTLMKTTGVFVLHRLLPEVIVRCGQNVTKNRIKKILEKIEQMTDPDWHSTGENSAGSSQGFFTKLYNSFKEQI